MTRHDAAATQGRQHRTDRDHGDARVRDRHAAGPGARAARGRALAGVDPEAAVRGGLAEVERDLHVVRVQLARLRDAVDPAGARDLAAARARASRVERSLELLHQAMTQASRWATLAPELAGEVAVARGQVAAIDREVEAVRALTPPDHRDPKAVSEVARRDPASHGEVFAAEEGRARGEWHAALDAHAAAGGGGGGGMTALDRPAQYDEPRATLDAHRGGAEAAPPAKSHAGGRHAGPVTLDRPAAWDEQRATLDAHAGAHDAVAEAAPHATAGAAGRAGPVTLDRPAAWDEQRATLDAHAGAHDAVAEAALHAPASHATAGDAGRAGPVTLDRPAAWDEQRATLDAHDHPAVAADRPIAPSLPEVATSGHRAPTLDRPAEWDEHRDTLPIQTKAAGPAVAPAADPHAIAATGVASASAPLPHLDVIQRSFGSHDVSHVRASVGGAAASASAALGAEAYATGDRVAFASSPSLHTAAHEAAHVVQQRAGVHLKGGLGEAGDTYEQHADAVADAVVRGDSAEGLLGGSRTAAVASTPAIQRKPAANGSRAALAAMRVARTTMSTSDAMLAEQPGPGRLLAETAASQLESATALLGESVHAEELWLEADDTFSTALALLRHLPQAAAPTQSLRAAARKFRDALAAAGWAAPHSTEEAAMRGIVGRGSSVLSSTGDTVRSHADSRASQVGDIATDADELLPSGKDDATAAMMPHVAGTSMPALSVEGAEGAVADLASTHPEEWRCERDGAIESECPLTEQVRTRLTSEIGDRAGVIAMRWHAALVEARIASMLKGPEQWGAVQEVAFLVLSELTAGAAVSALTALSVWSRRGSRTLEIDVAREIKSPQAVLKAVSIASKGAKGAAKSTVNSSHGAGEESDFLGTIYDIPGRWAQSLEVEAPRLLNDAGLIALAAMLDERFHSTVRYQQQVQVLVNRWRSEVGSLGTPPMPMIQDGRVYRAVWFEEDGDRRLAKCLVSEGSPPLPGSFAAPEQERTEIEFVDWFSADMIDAAVAREEALSGSVLVYRTGDQHLNVKRPLLESK